jgi:hypothetical protein
MPSSAEYSCTGFPTIFPTELVLPHIVGKPVQEYSAEEGMLSPANDVLRRGILKLFQTLVQWFLKVVDPHELSDCARDERFEA